MAESVEVKELVPSGPVLPVFAVGDSVYVRSSSAESESITLAVVEKIEKDRVYVLGRPFYPRKRQGIYDRPEYKGTPYQRLYPLGDVEITAQFTAQQAQVMDAVQKANETTAEKILAKVEKLAEPKVELSSDELNKHVQLPNGTWLTQGMLNELAADIDGDAENGPRPETNPPSGFVTEASLEQFLKDQATQDASADTFSWVASEASILGGPSGANSEANGA